MVIGELEKCGVCEVSDVELARLLQQELERAAGVDKVRNYVARRETMFLRLPRETDWPGPEYNGRQAPIFIRHVLS